MPITEDKRAGNDGANAEELIEAHLKRAWDSADFEAARVELDAALSKLGEVSPEHRKDIEVIAWINYATLAEYFGDFATAVLYNEKLSADDPDDLSSHLALLTLYRKLEKPELAAASLSRSGDLAERLADKAALAMLATLGYLPAEAMARAQRIDEAIRFHRERLGTENLAPSSLRYARIQYGLGRLYAYRAEGLEGAKRVQAFRDSIQAYRAALDVYSVEKFPDQNRAVMQRVYDVQAQLGESKQ